MANPHPSNGFKKGKSGNPGGYSKARRETKAKEDEWRSLLDDLVPKAVKVLERAIEKGDLTASKMVLERAIGAVKPRDRAVDLPALSATPIDQLGPIIMAAVGNGELTPETAKTLVDIQSNLMKAAELTDFHEFIRRIREGDHPLAVARDLAGRDDKDEAA